MDLKRALVAKLQRDGESQGPQRCEDLRRPAGTGSSGRVAGTGNWELQQWSVQR